MPLFEKLPARVIPQKRTIPRTLRLFDALSTWTHVDDSDDSRAPQNPSALGTTGICHLVEPASGYLSR